MEATIVLWGICRFQSVRKEADENTCSKNNVGCHACLGELVGLFLIPKEFLDGRSITGCAVSRPSVLTHEGT